MEGKTLKGELRFYLKETTLPDNDKRAVAEAFLKDVEVKTGYLSCLLDISCDQNEIELISITAAVTLGRYIELAWDRPIKDLRKRVE